MPAPQFPYVRQAVAIDERRAKFPYVALRSSLEYGDRGNSQEVWFPGVHSDVGGGYPEERSGLSKLALRWMMGEALIQGLLLDRERTAIVLGERGGKYPFIPPDPTAKGNKFSEALLVGSGSTAPKD